MIKTDTKKRQITTFLGMIDSADRQIGYIPYHNVDVELLKKLCARFVYKCSKIDETHIVRDLALSSGNLRTVGRINNFLKS